MESPKESRNKIADFLRDLDVENQILACNFLMGNPIENESVGVGEETVKKVLSERYNKKTFDDKSLGASFCDVKESKHILSFLPLTDVYRMYRRLSDSTSEKDKVLYLILLDLPNKQKKWFIDILLDKLQVRLGFGVIKHSLSIVYKTTVENLEYAWNVTHSIGRTVEYLNGKELKFEIGTPICPQLSKDVYGHMEKVQYPCQVEGKYDGIRCQVHVHENGKIQLFSRNLKEITDQFPDVVLILQENKTRAGIYDSEIYGILSDYSPMEFEDFQHRINVKNVTEDLLKSYPATIVMFDIIFNKNGWHNEVQFKRTQYLEQCTAYYSPWRIVDNKEELMKSYDQAIQMGYEGIMIKNMYGLYKPGEGKNNFGNWLKYKPAKLTIDTVVIGAHKGTGDKRHVYSSFDIAVLKESNSNVLYPIGKVGIGFTMETLEGITRKLDIMQGAENLKLIMEVKSDKVMLNDDGRYNLRFPRFLRFRPDKEVHEIDTLDMIKGLGDKS